MKRHLWLPSFLLIGSMAPVIASADTGAERDVLAKVIHDLNALDSAIKQAEANANPDSRIRFRYDWLRQDLERIKEGIQAHIDSPRAQPRSFPPLRGDYRR